MKTVNFMFFMNITDNINPDKASIVFATYRKGIDEITEINLRQYISDSLIKNAVTMDINELTQGGKTKLLNLVTKDIKAKALRDNPDIIQLNAIEKWDGKLPIYMTDGSVMPFVQVK